MELYTEEELKQLPEFEDLDEALGKPENVIRFRAYGQEDAAVLERVVGLKNLQALSISLSDVSRLLPRLGELTALQKVYLQACNISTLPESLLGLRHLCWLHIGNNPLRELPVEIGNLEALEHLGLGQNTLVHLPDSIGRLTRLNTLVLSHNQIVELPESIGNLRALESLHLGVNQLRQIPEVIGSLQGLQGLSLDYNKLKGLPQTICQLTRLNRLSLEHNAFESLPAGLYQMTGLEISIEAEKRALFMDWSFQPSEKPPQVELSELRLFVDPSSQLYPSLKAAIQESGLAEMESVILCEAREAICIQTTVPDDGTTPGVSRLGGFPDLSDPSLFPKTNDLHWIFLAQLNLAEIAPFNSYLPRSGLLSFFLDSTEALNGKILFHQGDVQNLGTVRHAGADDMFSSQDDYTENPHRLKFGRFFSLPHSAPAAIEDDQACGHYGNFEPFHAKVDHHINGHTFTQHESPQERAANSFQGQPSEWVPLLQLGWDSNVGFCFWDAGTVTFCIHQEDLRRWDFSKVHVSLES